jgi:hypothetical protein
MMADSAPNGSFVKVRYLWKSSAIRLLRERSCARYAQRATPQAVGGFAVRFPEPEISLGLQVTVRSCRLEGQDLFSMLYQEAMREISLEVGLLALEALHTADVSSAPFALSGLVYRLARGPRVALREMLGSILLSPAQRKELNRLVVSHISRWGGRKVLVHGDLHASHVIVDLDRKRLGFIDLEAMHIGKAATNFAQLWGGFHYADRLLGQRFYREYKERFPDPWEVQFDTDVRVEVALRSYAHVKVGRQEGNRELEGLARALLARALSGASFEEICLGEGA